MPEPHVDEITHEPTYRSFDELRAGLHRRRFRRPRPLVRVRTWVRQLRWFWQRGRHGYSTFDTFSLDAYLAGWLPLALEQLRTRNIGYPAELSEEGWDTMLVTMRDGFLAATRIIDLDFDPADTAAYEELKATFDAGMVLFHEWFFGLWD